MKKLIFILAAVGFLFVSNLSDAAGPLENEGHQKGVTPLDDAGMLSGQVVNVNRSEGILEIRTTGNGMTRIQLDQDHEGVMDQLKNVKPGDKVMVSLTVKAIDLKENGKGEAVEPAPDTGDRGGAEKGPPSPVGNLSGEVVGLDRSEKSLSIKTEGGGITHVHLDEELNGTWKNVKRGDRIEVTLSMEATSVERKPPG